MFKGLSQVVSEELGGRGEAQTQSSVAAAAVEEPRSGGRGRERRPRSETHRQAPVGLVQSIKLHSEAG